jgi:N-acyl amino acid synthase of PEP-CTERM/exosortase system
MNWNKRLLETPIIGDITKKIVSTKASKEAHSISDHFMQFLQPHVAVDQALKEEAFKIRHDVYCEELAFEDMRDNGQETDEFDHRSIFSLIKHKPSETFTSCIRLVMSNSPDELLPIEKYSKNSMTNKELNPENFKRTEIAEISRLAVKSDFRRRKADNYKGASTGVISEINYSETGIHCFPFIAIGLYMAAAIMCINTGIRHIYVMMEPRLARSLKFIGITFQQLGEPVDYHGLRAPYYINPELFMKNLSPGFKILYKTIEKEINLQLNQLDLT